jgi:hypothetical protein
MQWYLHRVTAMSRAAEPQDDFHGDDDNSDDDDSLIMSFREDGWADDNAEALQNRSIR